VVATGVPTISSRRIASRARPVALPDPEARSSEEVHPPAEGVAALDVADDGEQLVEMGGERL
jgi:hypothetical protein